MKTLPATLNALNLAIADISALVALATDETIRPTLDSDRLEMLLIEANDLHQMAAKTRRTINNAFGCDY